MPGGTHERDEEHGTEEVVTRNGENRLIDLVELLETVGRGTVTSKSLKVGA